MSFELFFSRKVIKGNDKNSFSKPIIRISIIAISLGVMMMIISMAILDGFQAEIQKKIVGFGSHIQVTSYQSRGFIESTPISRKRSIYNGLDSLEGVKHTQVYAYKGVILKTDEENYGALLKGISDDFDWSFFEQYIIEGEKLSIDSNKQSNEILISKLIADKLKVTVNDELIVYFLQQPPRFRKLKIKGIYDTGLSDMDERMVFADIRFIQTMNEWDEYQVGGYEILIDNFSELDKVVDRVYEAIDYDLVASSIKDNRIDIFNWLELQDINVIIIITLLILVCGIDMISALLILILERTKMIGVLKAIGARDKSIQKIFLYNAAYLIIMGLIFGNIFGIGIALLQEHFGLVKMPQEAYFIDTVPISINWLKLILLNISTLTLCLLMLIIPSKIISKISPVKTIRFD